MTDSSSKRPSINFVAAILVGLAVLFIVAGLTMRALPGPHDSPTATVDGKSVVGKTGS